jgi:hypothetical protein
MRRIWASVDDGPSRHGDAVVSVPPGVDDVGLAVAVVAAVASLWALGCRSAYGQETVEYSFSG